MITEQQAVERAKQRLTEINAPFQNRKMKVSLEGNKYTVVFEPPEEMLAGDFTVIVDANTGEVLEAIIER